MSRLVVTFALLATLPLHPQDNRGPGRLDGSGAFFYPEFAGDPDQVLAETNAGPLLTSTYLRHLAGEHGTRQLEDLVFDFVLARECAARRLVRSAPVLARSLATRRLSDSGRISSGRLDPGLRQKFATEALRQMRIDALVRADRKIDDAELRRLFERRYGVGGVSCRVRQVLVSFTATRRRLAQAGEATDVEATRAAAETRARELDDQLRSGTSFQELITQSDDRAARRLRRDPERADQAGFVSGYDQQRYGAAFAKALAELEVGEFSPPVETAAGLHLLQLASRTRTSLADVAPALRAEILSVRVTPAEENALRAALFEKYRVRLNR